MANSGPGSVGFYPAPRRLGLGLVFGIVLAAPVMAQRPGAQFGRFEIPGMDWGPNAAWRARARQVRETRWALLRRGDLNALNGSGVRLRAPSAAPGAGPASLIAVTGTFYVPVLPIAFKDVAVDFPISDFESLLFAVNPPFGRPYTVKTYYEQVSNGMIQMFGRVFDPVTTDSGHTFYEQTCNGIGVRNTCPVSPSLRFGRMLIAVLDSVSNRAGADTVWSRFDNDGPDGIPNSGDDDGVVDFVTFLQPAVDGACTTPGIWAHRFVVSAWNGGSKYVTKTPVKDQNGQPKPGEFIKVDNYTIQSQVGGGGGCTAGQIMAIGTVAHETGHAFGLPDLYDTDFNGSGTEGIGEWGIMGSGNYTKPFSPTGYDAWSLNELGWVTIDTLGASRTVTTRARQLSDTVFLAPTDNSNEFVLVENRQRFHSDTAMLDPNNTRTGNCKSNCKKEPGLLIWHIDLARIAAGVASNQVNTGQVQGVALMQADGVNQLRTRGANRGDAGDPFPGTAGNTRFGLSTEPAARTNIGLYDGFVIDSIEQLANGVMKFRFLRRRPTVVSAELFGAKVRVNGNLVSRFEDVVAQGEQFTISVDQTQELNLGRTHARFLAWSIGGPPSQTITSGPTPDTISATFAAEHRVRVLTLGTGQGTVSANRAGDLAVGIFLEQGTPVTLTATPAAGSVFAGWRGDTTAIASSIALPMEHPYEIEAAFVTEVAVAVADATQDVLGVPRLTPEQKQFLDQLGNRNGVYDVGDFLALLRRGGQAVPPALARALAEKQRAGGAGKDAKQ